MANDKTEKATPKRQEEARNKGQVPRSNDLNGSLVLIVGIMVLAATGQASAERMGDALRHGLMQASDPSVVQLGSLGSLLGGVGTAVALCVAPVALACMLTGVVVSMAQVGVKPKTESLKPQPQRLNPVSGFKNIYGPSAIVELVKGISKIAIVGAVVFSWVAPQLTQLAALVGMDPMTLGSMLSSSIKGIVLRAGAAYFLIGVGDYAWQRHKHEKSLRMDKHEIKEEAKGQQLPAEVRGQIRRRQITAARARMMQDVPTADVVITNPTHFAVALLYDGTTQAPKVIAKGQDLIAQRIKEIARESGVPVVEDKPLARGLHAAVEVGEQIPEELYAAVAEVLAWVYRTRRRTA